MAGGIALPFVVGEALDWSLPFVASMFALQLLAERRPAPTFAAGSASLAAFGLALLAALVLAGVALPYPAILALGLGLTVFAGFYADARSASPFWGLFLIAVSIMPMLVLKSEALARSFAGTLFKGMGAAFLAVWLMYALFPEDTRTPPAAAAAPCRADAARRALIGTLVIMPLIFLLSANESTAVVAIVTALSIIRASSSVGGPRAALALVLGNLIAGVAAIAAYTAIVVAPSLPILVAVITLVALLFARAIVAAGPAAPLVIIACNAMLVLVGLGISPFGETPRAFALRIAEVILVTLYSIGLLSLFEAGKRPDRLRMGS